MKDTRSYQLFNSMYIYKKSWVGGWSGYQKRWMQWNWQLLYFWLYVFVLCVCVQTDCKYTHD